MKKSILKRQNGRWDFKFLIQILIAPFKAYLDKASKNFT